MAPNRDSTDRDRDQSDDDAAGRILWNAGRFLSQLAAGDDGQQAWERGTEQLAPNASPTEIGAALERGVMLGMSVTEKRRAFREYHEQIAAERDAAPLVDETHVVNEQGDHVALRVLVSSPNADVFAGDEQVLIQVSNPEGDLNTERRLEIPFDSFAIEHDDAEGITQFTIREQASGNDPVTDAGNGSLPDNQLENNGRNKALDESQASDDETKQTDMGSDTGSGDADADRGVTTAQASDEPSHECVVCGGAIDEPAEHHFEEHPDERYDPAWYDADEADRDEDDVDEDLLEDEDGDHDE